MPSAAVHELPESEFSLVLGGPLYQLLSRSKLVRPPVELVRRRIAAFLIITWLPLAILTLVDGTFLSGVKVPFIADLANVRFLVMLPLLIGSELIVHRRVRNVVAQFRERHLIPREEEARFEAVIARAMWLRNSVNVEISILILSYTLGIWVWTNFVSLRVATWYAIPHGDSVQLTNAGYWFVFVSLPIAQFILLRWYFRLFIWYFFLWQVSRLHLQLNPLHPDRAAGLGFLNNSIVALSPIMFAQTCFVSAQIGNQIIYEGARLKDFQFLIIGFICFLICLILAPLVFFTFQLNQAKLVALRGYGALASSYVNDFRDKWIKNPTAGAESPLGSGDIQSLADLANSFEVVRTMRMVPFDRREVLRLAIALLVPLLPLALTIFSVQEIVDRVLKLLF